MKRKLTLGQRSACSRAQAYLKIMALSRIGLIKQLRLDGFSQEDAAFGADHCGVDWNEQAVRQAKTYLNLQRFEKEELREQLEFEGFTHKEADFGVTASFSKELITK